MAKTNTAVATVEAPKLPVANGALPDYMNKAGNRGNEDVKASDMSIPRIKLLQKMSDEVDRHHANYVEGAKDGDFLNSITRENLGGELYVISIKFTEEYTVWKERTKGGGLLGSYKTEGDAAAAIAATETPGDYSITQTHSHILCLLDTETGKIGKPAIMDFSSSKLRVSRNWNTQINMKGGDRFSSVWKISSVAAKAKNQAQYMNLEVEYMGWASEENYKVAEDIFTQFSKR